MRSTLNEHHGNMWQAVGLVSDWVVKIPSEEPLVHVRDPRPHLAARASLLPNFETGRDVGGAFDPERTPREPVVDCGLFILIGS